MKTQFKSNSRPDKPQIVDRRKNRGGGIAGGRGGKKEGWGENERKVIQLWSVRGRFLNEMANLMGPERWVNRPQVMMKGN